MDYVDDENKGYYKTYIIGSGAWFRALLRGRFVILGLCERVHAVLQIGVVYGLLLNVFIEV